MCVMWAAERTSKDFDVAHSVKLRFFAVSYKDRFISCIYQWEWKSGLYTCAPLKMVLFYTVDLYRVLCDSSPPALESVSSYPDELCVCVCKKNVGWDKLPVLLVVGEW